MGASGLNYLDIFLLAVMIILAVRGALRGFLKEIAGVIGFIGGVVAAGRFYREAGDWLAGFVGKSDWTYAVAYVLILMGVILVTGLVARILGKIMSIGCAEAINHVGGAAAGFLKGFALACAVSYAACLILPQSELVTKSQVLPLVRGALELTGTELPRIGMWRYLPQMPDLPSFDLQPRQQKKSES